MTLRPFFKSFLNITYDLVDDFYIYLHKISDEISDFFFPIKSRTRTRNIPKNEQKALDAINKELNDKDYKLSNKERIKLNALKKKIVDHQYSKLSKKDLGKVDDTIKTVEDHEKAAELLEEKKQAELEQKNEDAKKELQKSNPTALQQIEQVFEEWVLPTLLLILPRFTEDSLFFAQLLAPNFTGVRSERDLFLSFSFLSPTLAVSSNRQSFGLIYCPDPQYAFNGNFSASECI